MAKRTPAKTRTRATTQPVASTPDDPNVLRIDVPMPSLAPIPRLESYIRQHDETVRALATVRLEGGGNGDGTYVVDHPVPRIIANNASRYTISREEDGVSVYIWVNP